MTTVLPWHLQLEQSIYEEEPSRPSIFPLLHHHQVVDQCLALSPDITWSHIITGTRNHTQRINSITKTHTTTWKHRVHHLWAMSWILQNTYWSWQSFHEAALRFEIHQDKRVPNCLLSVKFIRFYIINVLHNIPLIQYALQLTAWG